MVRETLTHLIMFDKVHKRRPLHLHRLAVPVVQRQDKVEEVGLAEIRGRLLLKVSSRQGNSTEDTAGRDSQLNNLIQAYSYYTDFQLNCHLKIKFIHSSNYYITEI